jgi:hypothetical protein
VAKHWKEDHVISLYTPDGNNNIQKKLIVEGMDVAIVKTRLGTKAQTMRPSHGCQEVVVRKGQ